MSDDQTGPSLEFDVKPGNDAECTQACLTSLQRTLSNSSELFQFSDAKQKCCPLHTRWHAGNIPPDAYLSMDIAPKQTSCEIEVDVSAADILNRLDYLVNAKNNTIILV